MMLVRVTPAAATAVAQGAAPSARPFDIPTPVRGTVSSTSVLPAVDSSRFVVVNVSSCCAVRAIGLKSHCFVPHDRGRSGYTN